MRRGMNGPKSQQHQQQQQRCICSLFEKDLIVVVFWGSEGPSFIFYLYINNVISFTYLVSKPNRPFLHELNQNCGYINNIREWALITKDVYNHRSPSLGISFDKPQMLIIAHFLPILAFKAHNYHSFDITCLFLSQILSPHCRGHEMMKILGRVLCHQKNPREVFWSSISKLQNPNCSQLGLSSFEPSKESAKI